MGELAWVGPGSYRVVRTKLNLCWHGVRAQNYPPDASAEADILRPALLVVDCVAAPEVVNVGKGQGFMSFGPELGQRIIP